MEGRRMIRQGRNKGGKEGGRREEEGRNKKEPYSFQNIVLCLPTNGKMIRIPSVLRIVRAICSLDEKREGEEGSTRGTRGEDEGSTREH
jgi:hypothetical protein